MILIFVEITSGRSYLLTGLDLVQSCRTICHACPRREELCGAARSEILVEMSEATDYSRKMSHAAGRKIRPAMGIRRGV
jgi:hypothetical protein